MIEPQVGGLPGTLNEGTPPSARPGAMAPSPSSHDNGPRAVCGPDASEMSAVGGYLTAMIGFSPASARSPARPCPVGPDLINFFLAVSGSGGG
jgi:hypothetical protein